MGRRVRRPRRPGGLGVHRAYSPYHNISDDRHYPAAADHHVDPRRPRAPGSRPQDGRRAGRGRPPVLYYENIEGGHAGAADNEQAAFKSALIFEFLWRTTGVGRRRRTAAAEQRHDDAETTMPRTAASVRFSHRCRLASAWATIDVGDRAHVAGGLVQRIVDVAVGTSPAPPSRRHPLAAPKHPARQALCHAGAPTASVSNATTPANTATPMLTHGPHVASGAQLSRAAGRSRVSAVTGTVTVDGTLTPIAQRLVERRVRQHRGDVDLPTGHRSARARCW